MPDGVPLGRAFFARPAVEVARELVGKMLVHADEGLAARIVETEAYDQDDPASHAYRRRTVRNAPLYGPAGHAYVYFSYGMHWCLNVATGMPGHGEGVLLRAAEPLEGLELMRERRGPTRRALQVVPRRDRDLLRGPARLAQAFGLDGSWSGRDICGASSLCVVDAGGHPVVAATPRVGVSHAADWPWRYVESGSPWLSPYKRSPRAPSPAALGDQRRAGSQPG